MDNSIHVSVLQCGSVVVAKSQLFNTEDKGMWDMALFNNRKPDERITIPILAFLIEHPAGKILFDTGWPVGVRDHPVRTLGLECLCDIASLPYGQAVDEILRARGIEAEDLTAVVISHMHTDHIGGLREVAAAKRVLIHDIEWSSAQDRKNHLVYDSKFWKDIDITTFHMADTGIGPVGSSFDLLGDGSITLVNLPGHTPGLTGVLIKGRDKQMLLAADCGFNRHSWEDSLLPTICPDRENMTLSFEWIRELSSDPKTIDCLTAHETELPIREFDL